MQRKFIAVFLLVVSFAVHAADSTATTATNTSAAKSLKVLFIGNSLTFQNNLPAMLKTLCEQGTPSVKLEAVQVTQGGFTLEKHWAGDKALPKIKEGGWDYVVLQENSAGPTQKYDSMTKHMRLFDAEIKKVKAKTLLYMTWALQKTPEDQPKITSTYQELGKELGDVVVPVGIARENAAKGDATLNLYVKDGKHPTPAGTYLAACAFYVVLTGNSPKGLPSKIVDPKDPKKMLVDITADQAAYLQKVAEDTVHAQSK